MTTNPFRPLPPGEPVPWFTTASLTNSEYHFNTVAGRHVLLFFPGSLRSGPGARVHASLLQARALFDDVRCSLFIVAGDRSDIESGSAKDHIPGIRPLLDYDLAV